MIPFTVDQFLNVFEQYNVAVWPAQVFLYTIGMFAISLVLSRKSDFSRIVSLILSLFWIWMGIVYHLWFFSAINKAASLPTSRNTTRLSMPRLVGRRPSLRPSGS